MPRQQQIQKEGGLKKPTEDAADDRESEARLADAGGGLKKPDQADADSSVDEAVEESFPASDPPSFNRGHSGRPSADRAAEDVERPADAPRTPDPRVND